MNKRLLTVPALGALLAFGAVACGGDDNTKQLDGWAKSVCDAARSPIAQSRVALADTAKVTSGEAPIALQKRLSADLAELAKSNAGLADAVDKAGAPKSEDGETARTDAVNELRKAAQGYVDVQKKLDALATDDQAKFADGLRSVGDQVQQLAQLSTQGLNRLQTGEAGDAMKRQPGCKAQAVADPVATDTASAGADQSGSGGTGTQSGAPSGSSSGNGSGKPSAKPSGSASGASTAPSAGASAQQAQKSGAASPSTSAG
ncbi:MULTISPECIES: small secreted protein [Kitasatospora]|uniref:Small secreted protein n=1 Tax=Kitasatospora arboriphila TaxID=258052 RepID=A0ABP4DWP7_9ACTN